MAEHSGANDSAGAKKKSIKKPTGWNTFFQAVAV
jgi:hypothetical protein